jgi:hypothetical protein
MNYMVENSKPISHERELELMAIFQAGGEPAREAAGELIMSQSRWIMSCIVGMKAPKWVDPDVVFADIMPTVLDSLNKYDPSRGYRLTTFMRRVAVRAAGRAIKRMVQKNKQDTLVAEHLSQSPPAESRVSDTEELGRILQELLDSNMLSQQSRVIVDRLIREKGRDEICAQLRMDQRKLVSSIRQIQNFVAIYLIQRNAPYEGLLPKEVVERAKKSMTRPSLFDTNKPLEFRE